MSDKRCPTCNSHSPNLHPAMQHEGEVELCRDPFHGPMEDVPFDNVKSELRAENNRLRELLARWLKFSDPWQFAFCKDDDVLTIAGLRRDSRAFLSRAVLEGADQWRPIESAPKDGTTIIIANIDSARLVRFIEVAHWCRVDDCVYVDADPYIGWLYDGQHDEEPTHWMSLPAAPHPSKETT